MDKKINTRPLIAFAFLAEKMQQGGDIVSGLIPLFKPVIAPLAGKKFDPADLGERIGAYYGLDIHPYAVEDIAPRLEDEKLLIRRELSSTTFDYVYAKVEGEFEEVEESLVDNVVESFLRFSKEVLTNLEVAIDEATLRSALLERLTKAEFFGVLVRPDRTRNINRSENTLSLRKPEAQTEWELQNELEARLDVLVASFLLDARTNNPLLYDLLIKITSGALVAEVILDFRNPTGLTDLTNLQIVLDAPFLMLLFDLGSRVGTIYAEKLFNQLKERGAQLAVFQHSLDEFSDNLKAVLTARERGRAFGETASRLTDPQFKLYATTLLPVLKDRVRERGISVLTPPPAPSYIYFNEIELSDLIGRINFHSSIVARERDAKSIAYIIRLRGGKRVGYKDVKTCGGIFLTRNAGLVSITEKFLRTSGRLDERDIPPCITDRYFAGLLWVMFGGERDGLPEYRLLANCARAVQAREDVIEKMHSILTNTRPEQAEHFRALMTTDRGSQYFMQLTLGDSMLVTNENYQQIYAQLEEIAGERVAKLKDLEIDKLRSEYEGKIGQLEDEIQIRDERSRRNFEDAVAAIESKVLESTRESQRLLQEATTATLNKSEELRRAQQEAVAKSLEAEERRRDKERAELATVKIAIQSGRATRRRIKMATLVAFVLIFIAINLIDRLILPNLEVGSIATRLSLPIYFVVVLVQFILTLWIIPEKIFGRYAERKQLEIANSILDAAGMLESLDKYDIDWGSGEVMIPGEQKRSS